MPLIGQHQIVAIRASDRHIARRNIRPDQNPILLSIDVRLGHVEIQHRDLAGPAPEVVGIRAKIAEEWGAEMIGVPHRAVGKLHDLHSRGRDIGRQPATRRSDERSRRNGRSREEIPATVQPQIIKRRDGDLIRPAIVASAPDRSRSAPTSHRMAPPRLQTTACLHCG